jgi:nitrite reductase (cytochrome c-552)
VLNINNACQTCHKWPEAELRGRVETIQERVFGLRNRAMEAVVALIGDIKESRAGGKSESELDQPRKLQRRAQFMLDFVEAENSTGFHAPEEAERILAESIDYARQGQLALRGVKVPGVPAAQASKPLTTDKSPKKQ